VLPRGRFLLLVLALVKKRCVSLLLRMCWEEKEEEEEEEEEKEEGESVSVSAVSRAAALS
jgi:hypothetical protein